MLGRRGRGRYAPRAVRQLGLEGARDVERQPRLADPARSGERDEPYVGRSQQSRDSLAIFVSADRSCQRRRQPASPRRRAGGCLEGRVVTEDGSLEPAERRAGLDSQLVDERATRLLVGLERLRLPSCAIERDHELRPKPLSKRIRLDERFELADHQRVAPEGQLRFDPMLDRGETQILQTRYLTLREPLVREVRQRRAPPEPERPSEQLDGSFGHGTGQGPRALLDELLEELAVELTRPNLEQVAATPGHERVARTVQCA